MADGTDLGGAKITIKDNNGMGFLDAATDGPLFFAKLPAGNYNYPGNDNGTDAHARREYIGKGTNESLFHLE